MQIDSRGVVVSKISASTSAKRIILVTRQKRSVDRVEPKLSLSANFKPISCTISGESANLEWLFTKFDHEVAL